MKLKIYNGKMHTLVLEVLAGGHDLDSGKMVFIVRGEGVGSGGTMHLEVTEALRLAHMITSTAPKVERIEPSSVGKGGDE